MSEPTLKFDIKTMPRWFKMAWPMAKQYLKGIKLKIDHSAKTISFTHGGKVTTVSTDEVEAFINGFN